MNLCLLGYRPSAVYGECNDMEYLRRDLIGNCVMVFVKLLQDVVVMCKLRYKGHCYI